MLSRGLLTKEYLCEVQAVNEDEKEHMRIRGFRQFFYHVGSWKQNKNCCTRFMNMCGEAYQACKLSPSLMIFKK